MLFKLLLGVGTRLKLTKSPFVDDLVVASVIEKTWSNPGLHDECRQNSCLINTPTELVERGVLGKNRYILLYERGPTAKRSRQQTFNRAAL